MKAKRRFERETDTLLRCGNVIPKMKVGVVLPHLSRDAFTTDDLVVEVRCSILFLIVNEMATARAWRGRGILN